MNKEELRQRAIKVLDNKIDRINEKIGQLALKICKEPGDIVNLLGLLNDQQNLIGLCKTTLNLRERYKIEDPTLLLLEIIETP